MIQLNRVIELAPNNFPARLELAGIFLKTSLPDQALSTISDVEAQPGNYVLNSTNRADLFAIKTSALYLKNKTDEADQIIQTELRRNPGNINMLNSILQVCLNYSRVTNAITAADALLRLDPDDIKTLDIKATEHLRLAEFNLAIPPLNHSLMLDTNDYKARLLRGIAYLGAERLDEAQHDFETLQTIFPNQVQVNYGLAEVAYHKKDTNLAIKYYQASISGGGTNTLQGQVSLQRLKELKGATP